MDRTEEEKAIIKAAKEKALNLLSYSDKTEKGLRDKLAEHGFPPYAIDEAISYVRSFHYLDDKRFAEAFIRTHGDRKSIYEIRESLRQKGVSEENIEAAFASSELDETATVVSICLKRYRAKDLSARETREKALRYLASKGFSYSVSDHGIRLAIEKIREDQ